MNFLHTFNPQPILFTFGPISIHWYGFFITLGIVAGFLATLKLAKWHKVDKGKIFDLFLYVIIFSIIGARIFYVLYNPLYFWQNPIDIFKIWQGGLAIHGGLTFGFLILWRQTKRMGVKFWKLASAIVPGIALGQAIGRWGNYFNQEVFGQPTYLPWGIPIDLWNRPVGYEIFEFFHPAFLYESIGSLAIFGLLMLGHWWIIKRGFQSSVYSLRLIVVSYLLLYSTLRFFLEFIRIDEMLVISEVRITQLISGVVIVGCLAYIIHLFRRRLDLNKSV